MKTVIITQDVLKPLDLKVHANLSVACHVMSWPYAYVRKFKAREFPFQYKNFWVSKEEINRR